MSHALVFGASGLAGWGVVNQLLSNYPTKGSFSKVTALVNRPLSIEKSGWPSPSPSLPKLNLVSGVNLIKGSAEDLIVLLKDTVETIEDVTHVFYFAYKQEWDTKTEVQTNCNMFDNCVTAVESLSPKLKFVVWPSGTKGYGIHFPGGRFKVPYEESMRLSDSEADTTWYHKFQDLLARKSKGKAWMSCEVRPDAIIGFVPNGSTFNLTAHWALYLSTYALIDGKGAKVPFPGTHNAYKSLINEASADMIAKLAIWASLSLEKADDGYLFNVADQAAPGSMEQRWPQICNYFGLEGIGPVDDDSTVLKPSEYIKKHAEFLKEKGINTAITSQGEFLDSYGYYLDFDRYLSLEKARAAGFKEEVPPIEGWYKAFDRFKAAGMIPS